MKYEKIMEEIMSDFLFEPWDKICRQQIVQRFRERCPGPYKIRWKRKLDENFLPQYSLMFENETEKTVWYLKWM